MKRDETAFLRHANCETKLVLKFLEIAARDSHIVQKRVPSRSGEGGGGRSELLIPSEN